MSSPGRRPAAFALWSSLVGLGALVVALPLLRLAGLGGLPWFVLGWALIVSISVAGGWWLARRHGTPGSGFVVALGAGMAGRLAGALSGGIAAGLVGGDAPLAYVAGLGVGFVPLQVFEMVWFKRAARPSASAGA